MGCLDDLIQVVNTSSTVNEAQLEGTQDGSVVVPTRDWAQFLLSHFKKLSGIIKFHHFRFSANHPGCVFVKQFSDSPEVSIKLVRDSSWTPVADDLPPIIPSSGLSSERQEYLFDKIREFCPPEVRDEVCPSPAGLGGNNTSSEQCNVLYLYYDHVTFTRGAHSVSVIYMHTHSLQPLALASHCHACISCRCLATRG